MIDSAALEALLARAAETGARRALEGLEAGETWIDIHADPLVSPVTHRRWIAAGLEHPFKSGKRTLVRRSERDAAITAYPARPRADRRGDDAQAATEIVQLAEARRRKARRR